MSTPGKIRSPKKWKKSSYERFKKPSRRSQSPWAKQLKKNDPLGKQLINKFILRKKKKTVKNANNTFAFLVRGFIIFIVLSFLTGLISFVGALAWYGRNLPDPNKLYDRTIELSTEIYDRSGKNLLYEIHGDKKRTLVPLKEIPNYAIQATIALEDQNFYKHKGFSLWGMFRGVVINKLRGKRVQGGSTLTQQLIKNAILTNERKVSRKIKELVLAYRLEKKYSKDEILQLYFNEIGYGSTAYGIESASQTYFGKSVRKITLAEAALLAALPKAPTYLSPYGSHTDELFWRQHYALDEMAKLGYITKEEAERSKKEKIKFKQRTENIKAPHFVMYVKEMLTKKYGERLVEQGGLRVYTTLDIKKQKIAEEAVAEGMKKVERYGGSNAALISLDAKMGQILAMVGSRDYFDTKNDGNVNVTIRPRQPGSSFKPIVYAAAFLKGYTPQTILYDVVTAFKTDTKDYEPKNYDLKEHGPVTIRKALAGSLNIPAVKTIYLAGVSNVLDLAEKMGYSTLKDRSRFGLSLVLGGGEVKLLEHAAAFGVFAREGIYHKPTAILKVTDKDGKILEEYKEKKEKVLDKNVAREISSILSDDNARSYVFGAGGALTLPGRPVAAKTGTTNDYRDAWTIGYTPSLVTGVWVGNNDNSKMKRGAAGGVVAAPIWNTFMKKSLADSEIENFEKPNTEEITKPVLGGENGPGEEVVKIDKFSGKLATENTPPEAVIEKKFRIDHSILHYVYKDDPRGPIPDDPAQDPQYENWEAAVQKWSKAQGFEREEPPQESDDLHKPENKPVVNITSHSINEKITNRDINIKIKADAPRGINKIKYFIDNELIGTTYTYPFNLKYHLSGFENGFHNLRAVAYDDVLNSGVAEITLNFMLPSEPLSITWIGPKNNSRFYGSSFPLTINTSLPTVRIVQKIEFFLINKFGDKKSIGFIKNPKQKQIKIQWNNSPENGTYDLMAEITEKSGNVYEAGKIKVTIQ